MPEKKKTTETTLEAGQLMVKPLLEETVEKVEKTADEKPKFAALVQKLRNDMDEIHDYFVGKIDKVASSYRENCRLPLNDLKIDMQRIKAEIQTRFHNLDVLPSKVDKAIKECNIMEERNKKVVDF